MKKELQTELDTQRYQNKNRRRYSKPHHFKLNDTATYQHTTLLCFKNFKLCPTFKKKTRN